MGRISMTKICAGIPSKRFSDGLGISQSMYDFCLDHFGKVKVLTDEYVPVDILVLPGGGDLLPDLNSDFPDERLGNPNIHLEWFDKNILPIYIKNQIPIFGICRGMQTINRHFGGTLGFVKRHSIGGHFVNVVYRKKQVRYWVNSSHHMAIRRLGDGLINIGVSDKYGVASSLACIEAIIHKDLPIGGVQWHPERLRNKCQITNIILSKLM